VWPGVLPPGWPGTVGSVTAVSEYRSQGTDGAWGATSLPLDPPRLPPCPHGERNPDRRQYVASAAHCASPRCEQNPNGVSSSTRSLPDPSAGDIVSSRVSASSA
jgi:hypothetical protein